jgi:hypothetical protein
MLQHMPLEHVFPPILANLSRAIKLCNDSEQLADQPAGRTQPGHGAA